MRGQGNGDPAFPRSGSDHDVPESGMSLREYFAGQALVGLLSVPDDPDGPITAFELAENCYAIADAMIRMRTKE